eukprot:464037_1
MAEAPTPSYATVESKLKRFATVCNAHKADSKIYCDPDWWGDLITKTIFDETYMSKTGPIARFFGAGWSEKKGGQLVAALLEAEPNAKRIFGWEPSTRQPDFNPHQTLGALCLPQMKRLKYFIENGISIANPEAFSAVPVLTETEKEKESERTKDEPLSTEGKGRVRRGTVMPKKKRSSRSSSSDTAHEGVSNYILNDGQSSRLQNQNGYVMMDHGYLTGYNGYGETSGIGMENGNGFDREFGLILLSSLSILLVIFIAGVLCGFGGVFIAKQFDCKCAVKNKEEKEDIIELSL